MKARVQLSPSVITEGTGAPVETAATPEVIPIKTESRPEHVDASAEDDVLWFAE